MTTMKEQEQQDVRNIALHHAVKFITELQAAQVQTFPQLTDADEVVKVAKIFEAFLLEEKKEQP